MLTGKPFDLEIITPEGVEFEGRVESATVPGAMGTFQILYNHAPIISELEIGVIKFNDSRDDEMVYATSGGFVQVLNNKVSIIVETAEEAGSIDVQRALAAKKRAEEEMARRDRLGQQMARVALERAVNRLRVAGKTQDVQL